MNGGHAVTGFAMRCRPASPDGGDAATSFTAYEPSAENLSVVELSTSQLNGRQGANPWDRIPSVAQAGHLA